MPAKSTTKKPTKTSKKNTTTKRVAKITATNKTPKPKTKLKPASSKSKVDSPPRTTEKSTAKKKSVTPILNTSQETNISSLSPTAKRGVDYQAKKGALQINHISKVYSKRTVVDDVSFEVNQGEVVGLLGPNGAGKTTSFYVAVGLVRPEHGKVIFDGNDITSFPMHKRSYLGIGYLPQEASVFRKLSVYDNVMCILEARRYPRHKRATRVNQILEQLHVAHVAKQHGYTLSGGERRRVEIARSLACDPKIILLDEPFAGVDPIAVKDIQTVIQEIQQMDIGILITDHNVRETLKIVSRAYIMSEGKVILQGTAKQLVNSKQAREIYLGDDFQL